jgi:hypothetical protein
MYRNLSEFLSKWRLTEEEIGSRQDIFKFVLDFSGFRPRTRAHFVSAKGPKTLLALSWPFGFSARIAYPFGMVRKGPAAAQTCYAQTMRRRVSEVGCTARHDRGPRNEKSQKIWNLIGVKRNCLAQ